MTIIDSKLTFIPPFTTRIHYVGFAIYAADMTLAIGIYDQETHERWTVATVCLPEARGKRVANSVWLKGWSEAEGLPEALEAAGVVKLLDIEVPTGHCVAQLGALTDMALQEMCRQRKAYPEHFNLPANDDDSEGDFESAELDIDASDRATMLAALRYWQRTVIEGPHAPLVPQEEAILFEDGSREGIVLLDSAAIDELCERINCAELVS